LAPLAAKREQPPRPSLLNVPPDAVKPKLTGRNRLARQVLLGPAFVRKAAATRATDPVEAWMLRQEKRVRESYVRDVLERGGHDRLAEIWMLSQPDKVRKSYIADVLEPALPKRLRGS
jgi:hypothetical protein